MQLPETNTIRPTEFTGKYHLESECNSMCKCSRSNYDPVCGIDGIMYYSPCHAGCFKELSMDNSKVYLDCECISSPNKKQDRGYDAINTMCDTSCNSLWFFVSLCFFVMFFTFLSTMPALSATLRYSYKYFEVVMHFSDSFFIVNNYAKFNSI